MVLGGDEESALTARRLYVPRSRIEGGRARLDPEEQHYLLDVLRLGPGAAVEVFDGEGGVHDGRLAAGGAWVEVGEWRAAPAPGARIWLAFALAKGERGDLVVQKATELGVSRLLPWRAERSVVRLQGERALDRARRWQRIAAEAARQCGRADVPEVAAPESLAVTLAMAPEGFRRILFHAAGDSLREVAAGADEFLAVVGPEGGLAATEMAACAAAGCRVASLGPRVLRAETAAIAAVALLQYAAGDLGRKLDPPTPGQ